MKILAIETSCDETAAAVVQDGEQILSNVIASQADIHAHYGGVIPEVAARSHIGEIIPVIKQALAEANTNWDSIDAIAVTRGPGLMGSLLIGVLTAKSLGYVYKKPVIGVNHIIAHAFAAFLTPNQPKFPILALTVSGGHTTLTLYQSDLSFEIVGQTQDDAAGEAFDKVAKLLGLSYPGGPAISEMAKHGDDQAYKFPVAKMENDLDFSFSGLKTAVLRQLQQVAGIDTNDYKTKINYPLSKKIVADMAASFERSAIIPLVKNTVLASSRYNPASVVVGGGVAANSRLRSELHRALPEAIFVPNALCGDNAAMIAAIASKMLDSGKTQDINSLSIDSGLESL